METRPTLDQMYVDRNSGVPLHYQIQVTLENYVKEGKLKPGDRLPNVKDLAGMLDVSLHTALKAVNELRRKGVLLSKRGAGTVVAPRRVGSTDIIMPSKSDPDVESEYWDFHHQIMEGLEAGFQEPDWHISMMFMGGRGVCLPHEFLASLHARRVDSLVAYRPIEQHIPLLTAAAREMPVVSLFTQLKASPVYCVTADVEPATRMIVQKRLDAGCKKFAFVASTSGYKNLSKAEYFSPHKAMFQVFSEMLEEAGIEYSEHIVPRFQRGDKIEKIELRQPNGKPLDPETVIMLEFPSLSRIIIDPSENYDMISYTEYRQTLKMLGNRVSFIYFGMDMATRIAAAIIKERVVPGIGEQGRLVLGKTEALDLFDRKYDR